MKLWSDFFDYMAPDLPGCPLTAMIFALRQSAIAFCEQSLVWEYTHPDISVSVGTAEYPYVPPDNNSVVHTVTYGEFNGTEIDVNTKQSDMLIWDWRNVGGIPEYVLGGAEFLTLVPTPNIAGTLKLTVVLKPSPTAEGIDDDIFNEYREAIVHGALARLMLSPKKPYTDGMLANYHMSQFTAKTGAAGSRAARNYTRAPLQTSIMARRTWP